MKTNAPDGHPRKSFPHSWRRVLLVVLMIIVGLLLIIRFASPPVLTHVVNRKLSELPEYTGRVGGVSLVIWRGSISVKDFTMVSRKNPEDGPVVNIPWAMITIAWRPLLHRKLGGHAVVEDAELAVFNDEAIPDQGIPDKKEKQEEIKERVETVEKVREWQAILREAFPMELSRFEMHNTRFRFVDRTIKPSPEVVMEYVRIIVTGLRNRREGGDDLPAKLTLDGMIKTGGHVSMDALVDPIADQPRFKVAMRVEGLELPPLNDFTRFYAKADVQSGRFTVFIEATAEGGHYQGYLKPFFEGLKFKAVREEKNIIKRAATAVASAVSSVLKNDEKKVATQTPFQGNFSDNDVDIWTTIRNLLRNAFVQSLREGFAGQKPSD